MPPSCSASAAARGRRLGLRSGDAAKLCTWSTGRDLDRGWRAEARHRPSCRRPRRPAVVSGSACWPDPPGAAARRCAAPARCAALLAGRDDGPCVQPRYGTRSPPAGAERVGRYTSAPLAVTDPIRPASDGVRWRSTARGSTVRLALGTLDRRGPAALVTAFGAVSRETASPTRHRRRGRRPCRRRGHGHRRARSRPPARRRAAAPSTRRPRRRSCATPGRSPRRRSNRFGSRSSRHTPVLPVVRRARRLDPRGRRRRRRLAATGDGDALGVGARPRA